MAQPMERRIDEERTRLSQEISLLRQQADTSARQYQSQLQQLRREMDANLRHTNATLIRQHQQQLDNIAATYNAQRVALRRAIAQQKELLTRIMAEQDKQIHIRIDSIERHFEEQLANEQVIADSYRVRMHNDWSALRAKDELRSFTDPYVSIIERADSDADIAYERKQYQAVTAIMVNSSAMISCWESEARSLHEERQALYNLCRDMLDCMQATFNSIRQPIDCDGVSASADLARYEPELHARIDACCRGYAMRMASAKELSIEELRSLIHAMERDQHVVQDAVEYLICLHRAYVRRLQCLTTLRKGLIKHSYTEQSVIFLDNDLRSGLKALYKHRYHKDQIIVRITTADPRAGQAEVSITLLPATAMDAASQNALCSQLSDYVASCLSQQSHSPIHAHANPVYVESNGLFRSNVSMQYRV